MFEVRNRAYVDNSISETAGKLLPVHPTARYKSFPSLWKKTRKLGGYVPRPTTCVANEANDFFPCCLSCGSPSDLASLKEKLAYRSANAGWLSADWWWDFGWMLPEDFVKLGIGVTIPSVPVERDRIFVFTPDLKRGYLDLDLEAHARAGAEQHESRVKIVSSSALVNFVGEIVATRTGRISIAAPRATLFGKGIEIWERYIFQGIEMPFNLPILLDGGDFTQEGGKIFLNGIALN